MKSVPIKLSFAEEVKTFVNAVNRYPYEMDLRAGRHVVDAKSILGIFSLDLSKAVYDLSSMHSAACSGGIFVLKVKLIRHIIAQESKKTDSSLWFSRKGVWGKPLLAFPSQGKVAHRAG